MAAAPFPRPPPPKTAPAAAPAIVALATLSSGNGGGPPAPQPPPLGVQSQLIARRQRAAATATAPAAGAAASGAAGSGWRQPRNEGRKAAAVAAVLPPERQPVLPTWAPYSCHPGGVAATEPTAAARGAESLHERLIYLEAAGVDVGELLARHPAALRQPLPVLRGCVGALQAAGVRSRDLGKVVTKCPRLLDASAAGELPKVLAFLRTEAGLPDAALGRVLARCPQLLVASVEARLRPALEFLRTVGVRNPAKAVAASPSLLLLSVRGSLEPKLQLLEGLGVGAAGAAVMVARFPALLKYGMDRNLAVKADFALRVMGCRPAELVGFPQYFGYSLEYRIRPRFQFLQQQQQQQRRRGRRRQHRGDACGAEAISIGLAALLRPSDEEFFSRHQAAATSPGEAGERGEDEAGRGGEPCQQCADSLSRNGIAAVSAVELCCESQQHEGYDAGLASVAAAVANAGWDADRLDMGALAVDMRQLRIVRPHRSAPQLLETRGATAARV
eukprot:SM000041S15531  [mRNA]  locus=s41:659454:661620:- [translate_table: standard]